MGLSMESHANDKLSKVEQLKNKRDLLNSRIQKLEALEKQRERKRDSRRKFLVGSYYLQQAQVNSSMDSINKLMDKFLTSNSDRALFGLSDKN